MVYLATRIRNLKDHEFVDFISEQVLMEAQKKGIEAEEVFHIVAQVHKKR